MAVRHLQDDGGQVSRRAGVEVPLGVLVQGFFVGMAANLFPLAPGGVGAVDAGMIGAYVVYLSHEHGVATPVALALGVGLGATIMPMAPWAKLTTPEPR